jgi:acyl-CoA reductase-like NAD-dependent aldehyde dehydrogenase
MMNLSLSASQLRRAADIKDTIESLQKKLAGLLGGTDNAAAPRKRRKMSAAGRARIAAAVRARWAKVKGAKKSAKPAQKPRRKMSAAARAKIAAAARARWAKAKAAGRKRL